VQYCNKWLEEKVVPNIPLCSIVVIGSVPYHTAQEIRLSTASSNEADTVLWLQNSVTAVDLELSKIKPFKLP
jgi:hypothetical protein